jgi:hypothetical protein
MQTELIIFTYSEKKIKITIEHNEPLQIAQGEEVLIETDDLFFKGVITEIWKDISDVTSDQIFNTIKNHSKIN